MLHDRHRDLGAAFPAFGGWDMPVRYTSDLAEHHAVRTAAGLFDISHMGEFLVTGADAASFLDYALAGRISAMRVGKAKYSLVLAEDGGVIDDVVVYRLGEDRFLVIAEANGRAARVVINKVALADAPSIRERFAEFETAGYPLHLTSVKHGLGLESLRAEIAGRTSALTGPSGVGKSSLMNTLFPGLELRTAEISESVNKGRHTTVGALLRPLPGGGFIADTPGLREVGLWGIDASELADCFPEFRPLLEECRFADCTHTVEPGCGVREAVEAGTVGAGRYESFLKLREELLDAPTEY